MTDIKENGHKWLTIADACQVLSVSERTLRRHMGQGKYETRLEKGRRMVRLIDDDNGQTDDNQRSDALVEQLQSEIQHLRDVVSNRDTQIATLLTELAESNKQRDKASQRSDTIVLQLSNQLEGSQNQLADMRKESGWSRLLRCFEAKT